MPTKNQPKRQVEKMELPILYRDFTLTRADIDEEKRTVPLAFSSESPVERWFGDEILSHEKGHVRLARLQDAAALLVNHNPNDHVGAVDRASIDSDKIGRAVVRFGQSGRAKEVFQDVLDGVRKHVSVGYRIHEMVQEVDSKGRGLDSFRATDWEPYEISFASIPADGSVGVGRNDAETKYTTTVQRSAEPTKKTEVKTMPELPPGTPTEKGVIDKAATRQASADATADARKSELARLREISALGRQHGQPDLAQTFIENGKTVDEFRGELLKTLGTPVPKGAANVGMSPKEVKRFSFARAINALANQKNPRAQEAAAFEFECSAAACEAAGLETQGIRVPNDVLFGQRDQTVGTATAGGHLVGTDLMGFIDTLEASSWALQAGTTLSGLVGNVAIPRATGGSTAYWVTEGTALTESAAAFDQVTMSPKTVGAWVDMSRKLTQQSSIDVEAFIRSEIALRLGLAMDTAAINGSGSGGQPTGILQTSGIGAVVGGTNGADPDWADIVDLETAVSADNALGGGLSYLSNYKVSGKLKKTLMTATYGDRMVLEGKEINGYPWNVSNQVPSDLDKGSSTGVCSALIFGNWLDLFVGLWGGLDLTVDPYSESTKGTVRVVAFQDCDIAVRHPESFAAMQDALTV